MHTCVVRSGLLDPLKATSALMWGMLYYSDGGMSVNTMLKMISVFVLTSVPQASKLLKYASRVSGFIV